MVTKKGNKKKTVRLKEGNAKNSAHLVLGITLHEQRLTCLNFDMARFTKTKGRARTFGTNFPNVCCVGTENKLNRN